MTPTPALWPDLRGDAPSSTRTWTDPFLVSMVVVSTALRVPGFLATPSSDEAGFLLVARSWSPEPGSLYGRYWVDRPPVLVAAYRWTDALAGAHGPRLLVAVLAAVLVVAVHLLARDLTDQVTGRVATVVAVVLLANPDLGAWTAKGEVLGTPFVVLSCLAAHRALAEPGVRRRAQLAVAAGLCAVLATGFKQSLVGGVVFGAVLLVGSVVSSRTTVRTACHVAGHAAVGAALPVVACLAWIALTPAEVGSAWYQVVGFRADASAVLAASDSHAPVARAHELAGLFVVCGMAPLLLLAALTLRRWWTGRHVVGAALVAMTAVDMAGVVVSGSFWHAYLIPLVPDLALGAALASTAGVPARTLTRFVAALAATATVAATIGFVEQRLVSPSPSGPWQVGEAIAEVASDRDTVVSLYGSAEVVAASGLDSPYLHLWSLPMRTMDPDQVQLRRILDGPDAPTWVVVVLPLGSWHVDQDRRLRDLISRRYHLEPTGCGPLVWLRDDAGARAAPPLEC